MTPPHAPRAHHPSRSRRSPSRRPGLSFAVVNGAALATHLLLACFAADFMATPVRGETGIGVPALLLQAVLLVWTAARYDRRAADSTSGGRRTAHEQGEF